MSKYIPAVKEKTHFGDTVYVLSVRASALDTFQEALIKASEETIRFRERRPVMRSDGLEYKSKYEPVVLKEVKMIEAQDE